MTPDGVSDTDEPAPVSADGTPPGAPDDSVASEDAEAGRREDRLRRRELFEAIGAGYRPHTLCQEPRRRGPMACGYPPPGGVARGRFGHVSRTCSRPACAHAATATFSYDYGSSTVWLGDLAPEPHPSTYDLCRAHAARLAPPRGWQLRDQRHGAQPGFQALAG